MPTEWLEVRVQTTAEIAEAVAEVLSRFAPGGVVVEAGPGGTAAGPVAVYAYLPPHPDRPQQRREVEKALGHLAHILPIPEPDFRPVAEEDWTAAWKQHLQVLHVGQRIVIRPSWLSYSPQRDEVMIELDPGMAFGTGLHPTTRLCLMALEQHVRPGVRLLDLGTGSGILAIAGAKLGASSVLALDTDPQAVTIARQNARLNGVNENVQAEVGSLAQVEGSFDVVLVNIIARVIVDVARQGLARHLTPEGVLVVAGLIEDQEEEVAQALRDADLRLTGRHQIEDWVSLEARRSPTP